LVFYPFAKEALELINKEPDIINLLFTCSHPAEIIRYQNFFKENNLVFKHVNENPDVPNTALGCFTSKHYFNVLFEDKCGFDPLVEWEMIYNFFLNQEHKKLS